MASPFHHWLPMALSTPGGEIDDAKVDLHDPQTTDGNRFLSAGEVGRDANVQARPDGKTKR